MSELDSVLWLGVAVLAGVAVDTYFWVRTTLRLRTFNEELQPRLELLDEVADRLPALAGLSGPLSGPPGPVAQAAPEVKRTKRGSPYVVLNGKARFLSRAQARALESGRSVPGISPVPPGALGYQPPPSPGPSFNENPPPSGGDFDFAGAAAELGIDEGQLRAFYSRHAGQTSNQASSENAGGDQIPPAELDNRPAGGGSVERLVQGLLGGDLDMDAAKGLAREVLYNRQVEAQGGPSEWSI